MKNRIACADIGGTNIKLALFIDGILSLQEEIATEANKGSQQVLEKVMNWLKQVEPIQAIGISTCGQVNVKDGSIHYANDNMPGYTGTKVKEYFETIFHVPCFVENDVYAAARGEYFLGSAQGLDDFICLTYGTGIGGGIFLNGKAYYGSGSSQGVMLGALTLHAKKNTNSWDMSYEHNCSTTALMKKVHEVDSSIQNGRELLKQIQRPELQAIVNEWIDEIVIGLQSLSYVWNVPTLILGGGILEQPYIFKRIRNSFQKNLLDGFHGIELKKAKLGNLAGLYGAYSLTQERQ
ncbi:ROK family protein [Bulleidia sp. zg-1006]|uniref:ROK family protein n=1 Tax=Bulleidia sp. zg-1006 TaxID=2806552 RepID=UPI00193A894F|nr:ROK family protein [Bulleidia sp. zg-1006]QRG86599.1 ROK family protein [Bulleidia sp. zg-1006]